MSKILKDLSTEELLGLKERLNADLALEEIFDGRKKEMDRLRKEVDWVTEELNKRANA